MSRYVLGRIAVLPLTLLVVSLVTFSILHIVPGDAADVLAGEELDDEQRAVISENLGLDDPFVVQFGRWIGNAVQGDLGTSVSTRQPVASELGSRMGVSLQLAVYAVVLSLAIGIAGGAIATRWRNGRVDKFIMLMSTLGMSIPNFFTATLLVLLVSLYIPSFGIVSYVPLGESVSGNLKSLFFPALSIAVPAGATFCRYVRGSTEDILRSADYVTTARAKGAEHRRVLMRHVMPNALVPLTTVAGLQFAYLIGGTVVIESIFALPGVGRLVITAIGQRDYALVQGGVLLLATSYVVVNLLVDLLYPVLDPRVRLGEGSS